MKRGYKLCNTASMKNNNLEINKGLVYDQTDFYNNIPNRYPNLHYFFSNFRGDDLDVTIPEILQEFIETHQNNKEKLKLTVQELNQLINENWDEKYLKEIMVKLEAWMSIEDDEFKPSAHTYKEWIVDLKKELEKTLQ